MFSESSLYLCLDKIILVAFNNVMRSKHMYRSSKMFLNDFW